MSKIIIVFIGILFFLTGYRNAIPLGKKDRIFSHRQPELTPEEINLLKKISLNETAFKELFDEIILSEIISNSILIRRNTREEKEGILFYGFKIDLEKYYLLKKKLNKLNLALEVSLNTPTDRWNDFKFPFYKNKEAVIDFDKQVYKIYYINDTPDFIEQIDCIQDKRIIKDVYDGWKTMYNAVPVWADNRDNILLIDAPVTEEMVLSIYEGKYKCFPAMARNIEQGWETKESKMKEIRNRLPFVDMFFYDE